MNDDVTSEIATCHFRAVRVASNRLGRLYESQLKRCDLKMVEFSILAHLDESGPTGLVEMADVFLLDRSSFRYRLSPLQRRGLVAVEIDPRDRRSRRLAITSEGRTLVTRARAQWREAQGRYEAAVGPEKALEMRHALMHVASPAFEQAFKAASN